jgi:hypothetical protein
MPTLHIFTTFAAPIDDLLVSAFTKQLGGSFTARQVRYSQVIITRASTPDLRNDCPPATNLPRDLFVELVHAALTSAFHG